jgi:hypothetical protein
MITLSWIIERLLVKPTEGTHTDVVITADWRCNGTQESFSGTCYGSCSFAPPTGSFTPYEDLTEQQVLDWCFANGVDQKAIEANVSLQIENQINPPVVSLPLPWLPPVPPLVEQKIPVLQPHQIVDPLNLPTSDVPPSVDGMSTNILG